jgi:hypothetical protein
MEYFSIITSVIQGKSAPVNVCVPSPITVTPVLMSKGTKNSIHYVKKGINLTCCISLTFIWVYNTAVPFQTLLGFEFRQDIKTLLYFQSRNSVKKKKYPARCTPAANAVCTNADTITGQTAKHNKTSYHSVVISHLLNSLRRSEMVFITIFIILTPIG